MREEAGKRSLRWALLICGLGALLSQGTLLFLDYMGAGIDLGVHYRWAFQFEEALREGYLYPRWCPLANGGLGEPAFVHYSPGFQYAVAAVDGIVGSLWLSMKLVVFLAAWLGGVIGFLVLRRLGAGRWSYGGALALQFAPMLIAPLVLVNAMPWYCAWPWVLATIYFCLDERRDTILFVPLAVSVALVVLTHTLSAFMTLLCVPFLAARELEFGGTSWRRVGRTWLRWGVSMAAGLALAGVYLLPALTEQAHIRAEDWHKHVHWERSFSLPVVTPFLHGSYRKSMQYYVGGALLAGAVVACVSLRRRRARRDRTWHDVFGFTVVGVLAIVLGSELAYPLYLWTPVRMVLRPTRFLFIAGFALLIALVLVAAAGWFRETRLLRRLPVAAVLLIAGLGAAFPLKLVVGGERVSVGDELLDGIFGQAEYATRQRGPGWKAWVERGGFAAECGAAGVRCETLVDRSQERVWRLESADGARVRLPVWVYPAWAVEVDGERIEPEPDLETGLVVVELGGGGHQVRAYWAGFATERVGLGLSLGTLAWLLGLGLRRRCFKRVGE